ncbi:hypothetical protein V1527DRAFT_100574 [Lipomyces starkeyi]
MDGRQVAVGDSKYCQKCAACRTRVCCDTLQELQQMYSGMDGRVFKTCKKCRDRKASKKEGEALKPSGFDLDGCYDTHEEFVEAMSLFLEQHDSHMFDSSLPSLRIRASLKSTFLIDNDISVETCTQSSHQGVQKRAADFFGMTCLTAPVISFTCDASMRDLTVKSLSH